MPKERLAKICDYIIEYGLLAIVFFIPIIFDFTGSTHNIIDIYKAVTFRAILTLALLAYAAKIFLKGKLSYRGSNKIFLLVLMLASSFFISSFFSIHPNQSFWGEFSRQQGFYNLFNYWLFFILLILNIDNFKQIRRIITAVIISASLAAIYGLIQYFNLDPVFWSEKAVELRRIFSSLGQPNWFGHYLILVLPLGLYALLFQVKSFLARFFIGLSLLIQLLCLVLTYSRAAWLGFFGSTIFLLLAWLIFKRFKKAALGFAVLVLIGAAMIIGLNIIKPAGQGRLYNLNLVNRIKSMVDFDGGSNKMRLYFISASIQEIKQARLFRLLVGYGPETLTSVFMKYYQPDWGVYEAINGSPDRAHNWFFDQILALGILGLTMTFVFYLYFIYRTVRFFSINQRLEEKDWLLVFLFASLTAYSINNLFSFSLLTNFIYLYLLLALAWLIINHREQERIVDLPLTLFSKLLIWLFLLAVSAVFIYTNNINQVKAEVYYVKARKSMQLPDCNQAINHMETVMNLSPNNNYYQEKFLFFVANCLPLISDKNDRIELAQDMLSLIKSIDDKEFSNLQINLARFYAMLGPYVNESYYDEAEKIFNKLILNYPNLTPAYEDFGRMKMWQGDYEGAVKIFKEAISILPPQDSPGLNQQHRQKNNVITVRLYENLGQAYIKLGNYELAKEYYNKAIRLDPYRATLYKGLADIHYLRGELDQAIGLNQRGMTLNPRDYHWPLALSLLYRDKNNLTKAKEYLGQAMTLAPENKELKQYEQELNK